MLARAPILLFSFDERGIISLFEERGRDAPGPTPHTIVGSSIFQNLPRFFVDYRERPPRPRRRTRDRRRRGAGTWFEVHYLPSRNPGDSGVNVVGIATDITARKRAQDALDQQQAVLKYVIANVPTPSSGKIVRAGSSEATSIFSTILAR